jgi:hypothetical protein
MEGWYAAGLASRVLFQVWRVLGVRASRGLAEKSGFFKSELFVLTQVTPLSDREIAQLHFADTDAF